MRVVKRFSASSAGTAAAAAGSFVSAVSGAAAAIPDRLKMVRRATATATRGLQSGCRMKTDELHIGPGVYSHELAAIVQRCCRLAMRTAQLTFEDPDLHRNGSSIIPNIGGRTQAIQPVASILPSLTHL